MNRRAYFLAAAFLLLPTVGCSRGGEEFVGRWFTVKQGQAEDWLINSDGTAVQWVESEGKAIPVNHTWSVKNGSLQLYSGTMLWGGKTRFVAMPPSEDTLILEGGDIKHPENIRLQRMTPIPAPTAEERYALWEKESDTRSLERLRLEALRKAQEVQRTLDESERIIRGLNK